MDSSSIQLNDSVIEKIEFQDKELKIFFSRAMIIKTMTGSVEKTKWSQAGYLVLSGVEEFENAIELPAVCKGGDVGENIYTYRDMIPIPLDSRGHAHCDLYFENTENHLKASGDSVKLEMLDVPKYIEHIRPD